MGKNFIRAILAAGGTISLLLAGAMGCGKAGVPEVSDPQEEGANMEDIKEENAKAENLMEAVEAPEAPESPGTAMEEETAAALADFSVLVFGNCVEEGENTLVSPFSVLCTLAMAANGAKGETLAQIEEVLGADIGTWNDSLGYYASHLPEGDGYRMNTANSIWLKEDGKFTVEPEFLQTNGTYYGVGVYQAPFDKKTCNAINEWVSGHTDGMVRELVNQISEDAAMYLVNAVAFDAQWQSVYYEHSVRQGVFTGEDGIQKDVPLMYGSEYQYLEDDHAQGFLKYYEGGKYAFAALLPEEGTTVADYVDSLTGERLLHILNHPEVIKVYTAIPKFESSYSVEMGSILGKMGMTDAFDAEKADFSGIGSYEEKNLFISRVLHKTYIGVNEQGTKAGAATAVEAAAGAVEEAETRTVYLNRPFVYMIVDCETGLPLFLGVMVTVHGSGMRIP